MTEQSSRPPPHAARTLSGVAALGCAFLLSVSLLAGCGDSDSSSATSNSSSSASSGGGGSGGGGSCLACGEPQPLAVPSQPGIVETSGIVASKLHPGVYYAHNDSGDSARFFALSDAGADLGTFRLPGVTAVDWEDIARGPCADPQKSCLYIADFGDNQKVRTSYVIYRIEEPTTLGAGQFDVSFDTLRFRYIDGSHDAETLLAHPQSGELTVVTKDASGSQAFTFQPPKDTVGTTVLSSPTSVFVSDLLPLLTGGDVHPAATAVVIRSYTGVWLHPLGPGDTVATALSRAPCPLPTPSEMQGEAIGFVSDGNGYVTLSEGGSASLIKTTCPPP